MYKEWTKNSLFFHMNDSETKRYKVNKNIKTDCVINSRELKCRVFKWSTVDIPIGGYKAYIQFLGLQYNLF